VLWDWLWSSCPRSTQGSSPDWKQGLINSLPQEVCHGLLFMEDMPCPCTFLLSWSTCWIRNLHTCVGSFLGLQFYSIGLLVFSILESIFWILCPFQDSISKISKLIIYVTCKIMFMWKSFNLWKILKCRSKKFCYCRQSTSCVCRTQLSLA
jgi:hypothetical protein